MAGLNIFIAVIVALITKDGVFSCTLRSHKSGLSPGSSSESDSSSTLHHSSALCGPSLGQHRDALKKIPGALSDTTSTSHHSSVQMPHKPCGVPSGASPCPSSSPNLPNIPTSSKPLVTPAPTLSVLTSISPPTGDNNQALLSLLTKLLSSTSANNVLSGTQIQSASSSVLPPKPTSNSEPVPVQVAHPISSSSASISGSSSNVSPSLPCGLPSTVTPVPSLQFPVTPPVSTSFSTIHSNPDLMNLLLKLSLLVPLPAPLPSSKLTPLSPLCPLFTPTLNKDSVPVPVSKPKTTFFPSVPSLGTSLSGILPGVPCSSPKPKFSDSKPVQFFEGVSNPAPEEFPASIPGGVPTLVPVTSPAKVPTSSKLPELAPAPTLAPVLKVNMSTFSGHNPAVINAFLNYFLSTPVNKLNTTSVNLNITSSTCTKATGSNPCSSGVLPNLSNASNLPAEFTSFTIKSPLVPVPSTPILAPEINSGYNSAFIKHLIKHLLYHSGSIPPPLSLPFPQALVNNNPVFPPIPKNSKPPSTFNSNGKLSTSNDRVLNILSNKSSDVTPVPITNQNVPFTNNTVLLSLLCKLLLASSSNPKTHPSPLNPVPMTTLNTTQVLSQVPNLSSSPSPSTPPFDSLSDVLSKFSNILSGSTMSSPNLIPIPIIPLAVPKPFPELFPVPVLNITPRTPLPAHLPLLSGCHLKHLRPHHSSILRPPLPPHPCSHSKVSSGCKHV